MKARIYCPDCKKFVKIKELTIAPIQGSPDKMVFEFTLKCEHGVSYPINIGGKEWKK